MYEVLRNALQQKHALQKKGKHMDQLEVSITHDDSPASNDSVSIFVEVKMNGVLLPDILDITEFFEAPPALRVLEKR